MEGVEEYVLRIRGKRIIKFRKFNVSPQALVAQLAVPAFGALGSLPFTIYILYGEALPLAEKTITLVSSWSSYSSSDLRSAQFVFGVSTASPIINLVYISPYRRLPR